MTHNELRGKLQKIKCQGIYRAGRCWAAVSPDGKTVVDVRSIFAPTGEDYEAFRKKCIAELAEKGEVNVGEIIYEQSACWFIRAEKNKGRNFDYENAKWVRSDFVIGSGRHFAAVDLKNRKLLGAMQVRAPAGTDQKTWEASCREKLGRLGTVLEGMMRREGELYYFYWANKKNPQGSAKPVDEAGAQA